MVALEKDAGAIITDLGCKRRFSWCPMPHVEGRLSGLFQSKMVAINW